MDFKFVSGHWLFGISFMMRPASQRMKGGSKWCSMDSIYNAFLRTRSTVLLLCGQSYAITAPTIRTLGSVPTSSTVGAGTNLIDAIRAKFPGQGF